MDAFPKARLERSSFVELVYNYSENRQIRDCKRKIHQVVRDLQSTVFAQERRNIVRFGVLRAM